MTSLTTIDLPNALYYVELHGNGHCQLINDRAEFVGLCELLSVIPEETGGKVLAYCLFQDSIHLLVDSGPEGIHHLVDWLIDTHTQGYNRLHQRNGSLYGHHQYLVLIDPQTYLLPAIHHLHRLPVKTGLVSTAIAYPWSSQRDYVSPSGPKWLARDRVLTMVANHRASQIRRFEHFIENSRQPALQWTQGNHSQYRAFADDSYISFLVAKQQSHSSQTNVDLDSLTDWVCQEYGLRFEDLKLWRRHRLSGEVQAVICLLAIECNLADTDQVAHYFDYDRDLLVAGMRSVSTRRNMYLFKLRSRLQIWLREQPLEEQGLDDSGLDDSRLDGSGLDDSGFNESDLDEQTLILRDAANVNTPSNNLPVNDSQQADTDLEAEIDHQEDYQQQMSEKDLDNPKNSQRVAKPINPSKKATRNYLATSHNA